jgi:tetratricopeptide (TPR) repeat protein
MWLDLRASPLAVAVCLALTIAGAAHADDSNDIRDADALFEEGRRLFTEGRVPEACAKFAASLQLDSVPATASNLGTCYERMDRTASARQAFLKASDLARKKGDAERAEEAYRRADALAPRLTFLTVVVPEQNRVAGLTVRRDSDALGVELWDTPVPVDPGEHTVEATATGRRSWKKTIRVDAPGKVDVHVPALEQIVAPTGMAPQRVVGIVVAGAGIASLAVAVGLAIAASETDDESKQYCPADPNRCYPKGVVLRNEAIGYANAASILAGAGAIAAGVGVTLILLGRDPRPTQKSTAGWILPYASASGGGLVAGAQF